MPTWNEIISRFAARKPNPRENNRVVWSATPSPSMHGYHDRIVRAFCDADTLYSYGKHFTLAVYLGKNADGRDIFLKNGDKSTVTTNAQLREVQERCYGPTVSMSALQAAGIDTPTLADIVDWREGQSTYLYRHRTTGQYYRHIDYQSNTGHDKFPEPDQGMFIKHGDYNADFEVGTWHVLGATLIRSGADLYLCSLDEGSYFVTQLADNSVTTVDAAFTSLMPPEVQAADPVTVKRQGEWFFVDTELSDKSLRTKLGITQKSLNAWHSRNLPTDQPDSNVHEVRHFTHDGITYAKGRVFHRQPAFRDGTKGPLTREHKTLDLGSTWHTVHHNVQKRSWSMGGSFD